MKLVKDEVFIDLYIKVEGLGVDEVWHQVWSQIWVEVRVRFKDQIREPIARQIYEDR